MDDHGPGARLSGSGNRGRGWVITGVVVGGLILATAFALAAGGELCVGDLALALDATEDQVSYALKMLRLAGLVSFRKDGRMVCYRLSDGFPHRLLEQCLRELLTIAARDADR